MGPHHLFRPVSQSLSALCRDERVQGDDVAAPEDGGDIGAPSQKS